MNGAPETGLAGIVSANRWFLGLLQVVDALKLPGGYLGGGVIRNVVWDHLHGYSQPSPLADVDVGYFDPADVSLERDSRIETRLKSERPDVPWDVKNQAGVHIWFEQRFGHSVEPLRLVEEAVSTWPEFTTSVAVRLDAGGRVEVIAPLGLDDLFEMIVRRNPRRVSVETYRRRVAEKKYRERWPRARVIPS